MAQLSRTAGEQKVLLNQKKAEANAALVEIRKSMEQKAGRKQEVEAFSTKGAKDQKINEARRQQVEHELSLTFSLRLTLPRLPSET